MTLAAVMGVWGAGELDKTALEQLETDGTTRQRQTRQRHSQLAEEAGRERGSNWRNGGPE